MTYYVRDIDYFNDKNYLSRSLGECLQYNNGADNSLVWNYESCPFPASGKILEYQDNTGVHSVGSLNVLGREFLLNKKRIRVNLLGDFVVDKSHRTLSPALMLAREAVQTSLDNASFVYGYPNNKAYPVLKMMGFKSIGMLTRYACITSYSLFLPKIIKIPVLAFLLGVLIDIIRGSATHLINVLYLNSYTLQEIDHFDDSIDYMAKCSIYNEQISNKRTAEYLNWRFVSNPQHSYRSFICRNLNNNIVIGYVVTEKEKDVLHVRDIFALDEINFRITLRAIKEYALASSCSTVSISYLGCEKIKRILMDSGFNPRESVRQVVVKCMEDESMNSLNDSNYWYLLDGDEDQ